MFSKFFIYRPNFAIVIAVVITLAGLVSFTAIPVAQYPNVTPPQVTISVNYPGASAQTIVNTIAEPIEEQVNGAPGMIYMQSSSASSGTYSLTVTFAIGTDPSIDQVECAKPCANRRSPITRGSSVGGYNGPRGIKHLRIGRQPVFAEPQV